jgi:hypothetical protein
MELNRRAPVLWLAYLLLIAMAVVLVGMALTAMTLAGVGNDVSLNGAGAPDLWSASLL